MKSKKVFADSGDLETHIDILESLDDGDKYASSLICWLKELQHRRESCNNPSESELLALQNFRSAMEGIGHIRRTLEETFGGLHGTHVEPDVLVECKAICMAICDAYCKTAKTEDFNATEKLIDILNRHTVELSWESPPITLAELVIARDGKEELDGIRATLNSQKEKKDHEIRELVNQLRDIAVEYHDKQQLRAKISNTILTFLK